MKPYLLILLSIVTVSLCSCQKDTEETTVQSRDITEMLFASGTLEAENEYNLAAQVEGYIVQIGFQEGDLVEKGQIFAVIENLSNDVNIQSSGKLLDLARQSSLSTAPQMQQVAANIKAAALKLEQDQKQLKRYEKLLESDSIARLEYENILLARNNSQTNLTALQEQYDTLLLQSEQQLAVQEQQYEISSVNQNHGEIKIIVPGKVYVLKKQLGDYVRKGDIVATIASPDQIYASLSIDESNMGKITIGQKATIRLNTNSEKLYKATIREIKPVFDEQAKSFFVKAYFTGTLDFKIPDTQLEANILVGEKKAALVIPTPYLGYGNRVLLKDGSSVIVKPGIISGDWVEILDGLEAGTAIKRELAK